MRNLTVLSSFSLITLISILSITTFSYAKEGGAPSGNTGSPGDGQTCAHVDCHTGGDEPIEGIISTTVPESGYLSGETYTITVTINSLGTRKFGFQVSPQNLEGDEMGELIITNTSQTKFVGGGKYITHTSTGSNGEDLKTWSFDWTPEEATGDVTFYVAINIANNDDESTGDSIRTSFITVTEDTSNIPLSILENELFADITNPVSSMLNINFETTGSGTVGVEILNINGEIILTEENLPATGNISLDMSMQPQGIYFVRLTQEGNYLVRQIMKVN